MLSLQHQAMTQCASESANLLDLQAISAAAVQFLKLLGALLIVRRALKPYKPLPPNW